MYLSLYSSRQKYKITKFNIDDINEDPTKNANFVEKFTNHFKGHSLTDEQIKFMLDKTKIINWPKRFNSKALLKQNETEFKNLIGN